MKQTKIEMHSGEVTDEILNIVRNYDFYTQMIENSGQRQAAYERNRILEQQLRQLGVAKISNNNFTITI